MVNKKLYLSKIISCIIILSTIFTVFCFFEVKVNAADTANNERVVDFLNKLDIDAQTGEQGVTRLEFAAMIMKAVNQYNNNVNIDKSVFDDVEGVAVSYVNQAVSMGYFVVPEDKKFRPYDNITYQEASAVCVRVLGYESFKASNRGMSAYIDIATRLKLLRDVNIGDFTVDSVNRIVYNMLHSDVARIEYSNGSVLSTKIGDTSLLEEVYGIRMYRGVVRSINGVSIVGCNAVNSDRIMVDGNVYAINEKYDTHKYLGNNADYYITNMDGEDTLFAIYENPNSNTIVINGNKIKSVASDLSQITYYNMNNSLKTVSLIRNFTGVYNNSNKFSISKADFEGSGTFITLKDNDGDGNYDIVYIEKPEYYQVASVSITYERIDFKDSNEPLQLSKVTDASQLCVILEDGREVDYLSIVKGSCVEVLLSRTESGAIDYSKSIKILILENKVSGRITNIADGGDDNTITINEQEYGYISDIRDKLSVGKTADFYIGSCGKIVIVSQGYMSDDMYGYLVKSYSESDGRTYLKIFTQNNKMKVFSTGDKVSFTGYKDGGYVENKSISSQELINYASSSQLVCFSADDDDVLKKIVLAYDYSNDSTYNGYDTDRFSLEYHSLNGRIFNVVASEDYFYNSDSIIFNIPADGNTKDYFVESYSYYAEQNNVEVMLYDANEKWVVSVGVVITSDSAAQEPDDETLGEENIAVISEVYSMLNDDDEVIRAYKAYRCGQEVELIPNKETLSDKIISVPNQGEKSKILFSELEPGDVIQFWKNSAGKVSQINVLFRFNKSNLQPKYYNIWPHEGHISVLITDFGKVTKYSQGSYFMLENTDKKYNFGDTRQKTYIYEFNVNTGAVNVLDELGFLNDETSENPDYVFTKRRRTSLRDVVIYRNN